MLNKIIFIKKINIYELKFDKYYNINQINILAKKYHNLKSFKKNLYYLVNFQNKIFIAINFINKLFINNHSFLTIIIKIHIIKFLI